MEALQSKIESTTFQSGWTMTAMAMNEALKSYQNRQRKSKDIARVGTTVPDKLQREDGLCTLWYRDT